MKKNGFTLVETLIAMIIMSAAMIVLSSSWSGSYARIRKTKLKTDIVALLQRKMLEVDLKYKGKPLESIPEGPEEDSFGDEYPQYSWRLESKGMAFPDLTSLLTGREGGANLVLLQVMKQMTEHLSKTVKEVKVTVIYTPPGGGDPLEYSVTTYYVDYDKELAISGIPGGGG